MSHQEHEPTARHTMEDTILRQAIRIAQLEADNDDLRSQLQVQHGNSGEDKQTGAQTKNDCQSNFQSTVSPGDTLKGLAQQHAALKERYATLETKYRAALKKVSDSKQAAWAWKNYAEAKKNVRSTSGGSSEQENVSVNVDGGGERTPKPPNVVEPRASSTTRKTASSELPSSPPPNVSRHNSMPHVTSSQTTVYEPESVNAVRLPSLPSSDCEPVFVSARPVKRRRNDSISKHHPAQRIKIEQEPNSPDAPIDIKSDENWTSPTIPAYPLPTQISDLDAVGPHIATPRRRNGLDRRRQRASSEDAAASGPILLRNVSSLSEGDTRFEQTGHGVGRIKRETGLDITPTGNDEEIISPRSSLRGIDAVGALQPISVNIPRKSHPTEIMSAKKKSRLKRTGAKDNIAFLSEDGDDGHSQKAPSEPKESKAVPRNPQANRLDRLLEGPSPEKTPAFLRQSASAAKTKSKGTPASHLRTPISASKDTPTATRPQPAPKEEPLRNRPIATLQRQDFKVNPAYLGTTYAFSDTFRGRDQRRQLHTCTAPNCCGDIFKKAISMTSNNGSTLSGKSDSEALEAYLGPTWQSLLSAAAADSDRNNLITQAHAFCFANTHGKHRHAFQRASTPPGFWRTDFPSTQEAKRHGDEAREMERAEVVERWREAMREGGRWRFRDE